MVLAQVSHFAAATPAEAAPPDTDELGIASEFHGAALELVHGRTLPVHIVAQCHVRAGMRNDSRRNSVMKAPLRKSLATTQVVSLDQLCMSVLFTPGPIPYSKPSYPVAKYGIPLDCWEKLMCWRPCSGRFPEPAMSTLAMADVGSTMLSFKSNSNVPAGLKKAVMATFSAFPPLKMVTVVDEDVDIRNSSDVEWAMATRLNASTGIVRVENSFGHGLNPTFPDYLGTKVGFDCCRPYPHTTEFDRANYKPVDIGNYSIQIPEIEQPQEKSLPF
ncbi:MAG: hypothetical protein CM1200mP18_15680 [Gammaproteobacteria bacterium]|nr:MAG: hypothetical protein CM1200mP18_15680 [Gammaproteobacteria bacterium]